MNKMMTLVMPIAVLGACGLDSEVAPEGGPLSCPVETHTMTATNPRGTDGIDHANARICVEGRPDLGCALSGDNGTFTLCVPDAEHALRIEATGYETTLWPEGATPDTDQIVIHPDTEVAPFWTAACVTYPAADTGFVRIEVGWPGAEVHLDPPLSPTVYATETGLPDDQLTRTTSAAVAYFGGLAPGSYEVGVTLPLLSTPTCGSNRDGLRLHAPVRAGATTALHVHCGPTGTTPL